MVGESISRPTAGEACESVENFFSNPFLVGLGRWQAALPDLMVMEFLYNTADF